MAHVFLSYARADGAEAAARLRAELSRSGFTLWQDTENMQGGQAWKDQLRSALKQVDAVLVLMTPQAAVSKYVEWEWEMALMADKRVIPLLIADCDVPAELSRLHYHNLSTEREYILGLMALVRDLNDLGSHASEQSVSGRQAGGDRNISIGGNANNSQIVTGNGNNITQTNFT